MSQSSTTQEIEMDKNSIIDENSYPNINSEEQTHKKRLRQIEFVLNKIKNNEKDVFQIVKNARKMEETQSVVTLQKDQLLSYNRREKSLEELSKRFLSLFLDKEESLLSLDKITAQLGVERRRIYDIINILESLKLVSRKGKNNYKWNGFKKIYHTIQEYRINGEDMQNYSGNDKNQFIICQKREKSLEMLSIGFLKLFIHWKQTMTLEEAARRLSSTDIDDHKIKTKIRRLYDIANVFKSLGLIKKTAIAETKKPAFVWIGEQGLDVFASKIKQETHSYSFSKNDSTAQSLMKKFEKTHSSIDQFPAMLPTLMKSQSEPFGSGINYLENTILQRQQSMQVKNDSSNNYNNLPFLNFINNNNNNKGTESMRNQNSDNDIQQFNQFKNPLQMLNEQFQFNKMMQQQQQFNSSQQNMEQLFSQFQMKYFLDMIPNMAQQQMIMMMNQQLQFLNKMQQQQQQNYIYNNKTNNQQSNLNQDSQINQSYLNNSFAEQFTSFLPNPLKSQNLNSFLSNNQNSQSKTQENTYCSSTQEETGKSLHFNNDFQTVKKQKRFSSDNCTDQKCQDDKNYITPIIKKTFTIIKPNNDDDNHSTPKMKNLNLSSEKHQSQENYNNNTTQNLEDISINLSSNEKEQTKNKIFPFTQILKDRTNIVQQNAQQTVIKNKNSLKRANSFSIPLDLPNSQTLKKTKLNESFLSKNNIQINNKTINQLCSLN